MEKDYLSKNLVQSIIKQAMSPFRCHVEFPDHSNKCSVTVYFDHRDRYIAPSIHRSMYQHKASLEVALHAIRADLTEQGETLSPWLGISDLTDC